MINVCPGDTGNPSRITTPCSLVWMIRSGGSVQKGQVLINQLNHELDLKVRIIYSQINNINDNNFTIMATLGLTEYSSSNNFGLQLIPNPFTNFVEVNASGLTMNEKTLITIFDVLGNVIKSEQISPMQNIALKYDLSHLGSGVYIIQLINGSSRSIARMVKQ